MTEFKIGEVYAVFFLDHMQDGEEPIECVVFGRLWEDNEESIVVCSWDYAAPKGGPMDDNQTRFCIIKSAIQEAQELRAI